MVSDTSHRIRWRSDTVSQMVTTDFSAKYMVRECVDTATKCNEWKVDTKEMRFGIVVEGGVDKPIRRRLAKITAVVSQ